MKLKMTHMLGVMILLTSLITLTGFAPVSQTTSAQSNEQVYVVLMAQDPTVAYDGGIPGLDATKPGQGQKINPNSAHVRRYVDFLNQEHDRALGGAGVGRADVLYDYFYSLNGFAARLTEAEAAEMRKQSDVVIVQPDELRHLTTDSSPDFLGLSAPGGAWESGYTGEGVVVGIIDTGIWPEHPSFADDGSYGVPPATIGECNFGNTAYNPADAPFTCNNKLIGARQFLETYKLVFGLEAAEFDSARDDNGHGTHTASTSAGNGGVEASIFGIPRGTISGIAPRAHVVAYRACALQGCFTADTSAAIDQAVADGVDVLNYSIGGGASLTGADDIAFLFAADAGVFVATSAGNSGPGPGTIGAPASVPWVTAVGANMQRRFFQGKVVLGNGAEFYGSSVTPDSAVLPLVDAADLGNELCNPAVKFKGNVRGKIVLCMGAVGRAAKSYAVYQAGGAGMILFNPDDVSTLPTDTHWVPSVHIDFTPALAIRAYIHSTRNPTARIEGEPNAEWSPAPSMAHFSSRGPNPAAMDIIKPDVTAPGVQILAGNSPVIADPTFVSGQLFQAIQGTSMSSPHVAGVFALLKQAHPDWSAAMAKSALMTTAYQDVRDNDRVSPADPFDIGAGHIDPAGDPGALGSPFSPGIVYDAGFFEYLGFLCDAAPEVFANPEATCAFLASNGVPTEAVNLNYPSIGVANLPGAQTVVRRMTNVSPSALHLTAVVEAPAGFAVEVSPATLTVPPGGSASYSVHITNASAPIGEWRFGSLTWESDTSNSPNKQGVAAYSPIAVRASLFDAPAEVSGAGTAGSLSFDVKFGYTGNYQAQAHGLVPVTVTSANVLQDPDQTFSPGDVAGGGANVHTFNLTGALFFRIAMPPESTEANADLDIYVYDPNGDLVASSTLPGTDELIDLTQPMDGAWQVYVHGWAAPGGDSDYDLLTWVVPAAAGGSLVIDSAPASATSGTVGTIQVSWAGLAAGSQYLGAVSHHRDADTIGMTLVSVDTR